MLGGAAIGGFSSGLGAEIGTAATEIGGLAASSLTNSVGFNILSGGQTDLQMNFGFGAVNLNSGSWDWADFEGNVGDVIGDATGWAAVMQDAFRVQLLLMGKDNESVKLYRELDRPENVGSWYYVPDETGQMPSGGKVSITP